MKAYSSSLETMSSHKEVRFPSSGGLGELAALVLTVEKDIYLFGCRAF